VRIGLVGPTYTERSLPFDAQRTINLFPVLDQQGKETAALYGTPGLLSFATAGSGPIRGCYNAANGRAFMVSGNGFYEISSLGVATSLGGLDTSSGICSIDENGTELAVCDGAGVYILTYSSNAWAKVTDADLPTAGTITFIDGYFVVNQVDTGKFYISGLYAGTTWDALDFATAESSPDELLRVINAVGQLWLFGVKTAEIWTNTGDSTFPFQRISGAKMEVGILAPHTAIPIDNSVMWVGRDNIGQGIVYVAKGFSPRRISNSAIELKIQAASDAENLRAYTYQEDGHVFYVLTGGGLETTLVYDITTQQWHERAYLADDGNFETHIGACGMFAFGKQLVGDRRNGMIYEMSMDYYSDNGDEIARERIYTHLSDENQRRRYSSLEIGFETGVGLQTGQGSDPLVALKISHDGARTWSNWYTASIGAVGQYMKRVIFRRLGVSRITTFRIRITDPVKVAIIGSYLR
jgi:hypothetical protein